MGHKVTLIPGDGIGPEVTASAVRVIDATGVEIDWEYQMAGRDAEEQFGTPLPDEVLKSIRRNKVALKGPLRTPIGKGYRSANVTLRQELALFANLRPILTIPGVNTRYADVDLIIVRENSEDLYIGKEEEIAPGVVHAIKVVTEDACRRISEWAFQHALAQQRKRITLVHKANIMKKSDGLFLRVFNEVAQNFDEIEADHRIVDALCMDLVLDPTRYDVLLLGNLYGDIVSDLASGLVGGLGLVPGANIGSDIAVFEAVHGTAPDIARRNLANPSAIILTAAMMLEYLGEQAAAEKIRKSIRYLLAVEKSRTRDLGGDLGTDQFTNLLVQEVSARL